MPKIKDLGINTIPMTMRPPEIGPGGTLDEPGREYFAAPQPPGGGDTAPNTSACGDTSCQDYSGCSDTSCHDYSGCSDTSCDRPRPNKPSPSPKGPKKNTSAFPPDAIAQLRQQLESQIGM